MKAGVPVAALPPEIRAWTDPALPLPLGVAYHAAYLPLSPLWFACGACLFGGVGALQAITFILQAITRGLTLGVAAVFVTFTLLLVGAATLLLGLAVRAQNRRRAHKQGRVRVGVFLSEDALLDWDGHRAWHIPRERIQEVLIRSNPGRGGAEHGVLFDDDGSTGRRPLALDRHVVQSVQFWHSRGCLPGDAEWVRGVA